VIAKAAILKGGPGSGPRKGGGSAEAKPSEPRSEGYKGHTVERTGGSYTRTTDTGKTVVDSTPHTEEHHITKPDGGLYHTTFSTRAAAKAHIDKLTSVKIKKGGPGSGPQPGGGASSKDQTESSHPKGTQGYVDDHKAAFDYHQKQGVEAVEAARNAQPHEKAAKEAVAQHHEDRAFHHISQVHEGKLAMAARGSSSRPRARPGGRPPEASVSKSAPERDAIIFKVDAMQQIVKGAVLVPDEVDEHSDTMTADEIEKTAHDFLANSRVIGSSHAEPIAASTVESYVAPDDFESDGPLGKEKIKKGSWVIAVKVHDAAEWGKIMSGQYTGFSVGGWGSRD
jgi:hypothetical protein